MKSTLRALVDRTPGWFQKTLKVAHVNWTESSVNRYDRRRFSKSRYRRTRNATRTQLEAKLTFHAHALEKGLSHRPMRAGFGAAPLRELADAMEEYTRRGLDQQRTPYVNALSTLRAYIDAHREMHPNFDLAHLEATFGDLMPQIEGCTSTLGGTFHVSAADRQGADGRTFAELFTGRSSIREFGPTTLATMDTILSAVELSRKTPSVCNRQSTRVRIVSDAGLIEKALRLQGGMNGYPTPPYLLAITADLAAFLHPTERNQPYIDGGLFSMALMLALEDAGLASCPLNAMLSVGRDRSVRQLLGIPENEVLIMFLAVGEFPDSVHVPKSFRLGLNDIAQVIS